MSLPSLLLAAWNLFEADPLLVGVVVAIFAALAILYVVREVKRSSSQNRRGPQ